MTGTITQILGRKASFCLIRASDGSEVFAHRLDFVNPLDMTKGKLVEFRIKLATTGKRPAATDVIAA